jgi:hypothetical protein
VNLEICPRRALHPRPGLPGLDYHVVHTQYRTISNDAFRTLEEEIAVDPSELPDYPILVHLRHIVTGAVHSALNGAEDKPSEGETMPRRPRLRPGAVDPMGIMTRVIWISVAEEVERALAQGRDKDDVVWKAALVEEMVHHHALAFVVAHLRS